ncbi:MerR family transcriptional regulator [Stutzerimonas stutzeri]|uniref:MerR family transcriptional regulator n=1 Tax=Stutzerimonas stutzeri TaxID=316 RepID=A0A0D9AIJ0_STUST|nr:MerR family transcriptional regulator [Stutzerimonas stutzeri]KJH80567.1 MerR family transcriptional regulator [Stutzerimonas stutzeri]
MQLKVGELARRCGLTVRTLHHYDDIGLLRPSARSDAGYRLYNRDDVARLQQIQALRSLGVSLAEVGAILDRQGRSVSAVIEQQLSLLDQQIARQIRLRERLAQLHQQCVSGDEPALADWLEALELMSMYEKYFSEDELRQLPFYNRNAVSDARWAELAEEGARLLYEEVDPQDERAKALARRWMQQLERDTAADPGLLAKLDAMHLEEPVLQQQTGISREVSDYVLRAFAETKLAVYERYLDPDSMAFMRRHYLDSMREWPGLIAALRKAQRDGLAPDSEQVRQLARRWLALFRAYAGDDPRIQQTIRQANQREPSLMEGTWVDEGLLRYLGQAVDALCT